MCELDLQTTKLECERPGNHLCQLKTDRYANNNIQEKGNCGFTNAYLGSVDFLHNICYSKILTLLVKLIFLVQWREGPRVDPSYYFHNLARPDMKGWGSPLLSFLSHNIFTIESEILCSPKNNFENFAVAHKGVFYAVSPKFHFGSASVTKIP